MKLPSMVNEIIEKFGAGIEIWTGVVKQEHVISMMAVGDSIHLAVYALDASGNIQIQGEEILIEHITGPLASFSVLTYEKEDITVEVLAYARRLYQKQSEMEK